MSNTNNFEASRNNSLTQIPKAPGLPIFGNTFQFLANPIKHGLDNYSKFGPIFRTNIFFNDSINIMGPDAAQLILQDKARNFSSQHGYEWLLKDLFSGGLLLRDFDEHLYHRRIMQVAFKKPALVTYLARMNPHIALNSHHWARQENFLFYPAVKELTLNLATTIFLGHELGESLGRVNRCLMDIMAGSISIIRAPIPGLPYNKSLKKRAELAEIIRQLIPERRKNPSMDMLSQFCTAESETGGHFTDEEIINHTIFMWIAAHDTTSSGLSTVMAELADRPEWQHKIREECRSLNKPALDFDDLDKVEQLDHFIKECLRIHPPIPGALRRSVKETEFYNHCIPPDTLIVVGIGMTHFMEEYWSNPNKFDPDRFNSERAEHKSHAFAFAPFGGGAHRCIGMHFASMQLKAVLYQLILNYQWSLPPNYKVDFKMMPIPIPRDGLPVFMKRVNNTDSTLH